MRKLFCIDCGEEFDIDDIRLYACETEELEDFPDCGGILYPAED